MSTMRNAKGYNEENATCLQSKFIRNGKQDNYENVTHLQIKFIYCTFKNITIYIYITIH